MTNPNICKTCDGLNRSCCTLRIGDDNSLPAPISEAEIRRISDNYGVADEMQFIDTRANNRDFIDQMSILFPDMTDSIAQIFPLGKEHKEIKTVNSQCVFKGVSGCRLLEINRPHFCRIYPFWFFENEPQIFQDPNCLVLERNQTIGEVLLGLGTTPERLRQIYSQLCDDWGFYLSKPQRKSRAFF